MNGSEPKNVFTMSTKAKRCTRCHWIRYIGSDVITSPSTIKHPGGHLHWKGVWGCAAVMTSFFQASRRSLAYQFTVNAPLLWPPFSIFRKFLDFRPCFGQNSSSLDPNFSKFSFPRPPFFKENPLLRPYFLKPAWHTSTKKKLSAPPGLNIWATYYITPFSTSRNCLLFNLARICWSIDQDSASNSMQALTLSKLDFRNSLLRSC